MSPPSFRFGSRSRPDTPLHAGTRPRLARGVTFERTSGDRWVTMIHGVPSSRVSSAVVELLTSLDGQSRLDELQRRFAAAESADSFLHLIERFRASGLLDGSSKTPPGRVSFRPPLTIQLATLHAPAIFDRLTAFAAPARAQNVLVPLAVLLVAGIVSAVPQTPELWHTLVSPVSLTELVVLVLALAALTLLHECAHGLTLARFGGRPRRAGIMLFYLAPAFFVDVTDGWRLRDRRQRVAVALAGPAIHGAVGAGAIIVALTVTTPEIDAVLLLLALSCAAIVLVNLIPFVRFDGYLALMSALDEPNLRDRSIRDATGAISRLLFGVQPEDKHLDRWWSVPFGLASIVTPIVLVLMAVARIADALAGGGPAGGVLVVAVEAGVVSVGAVLLLRGLRRVLRSGASRLRFCTVIVALLMGVATAGSLITVPLSTTYGFFMEGGRVALVQAETTRPADLQGAASVVLMTNGILGDVEIARGTAKPTSPRPVPAPLEAFLPVTAPGATIAAEVIARVHLEGASDVVDVGKARVEHGVRSVWGALWATGVEEPLSSLLSDK
ncbi:daptide biosynthesis intramembrane metalloprotease [Microbacterium sp. LS_15]|uniref:daptide biosynthesis intramembrane metalloprotease n=1 Tax=Microbacterium sp. LS_15 TaxID=3055790 RepID=UPI0035C1842B